MRHIGLIVLLLFLSGCALSQQEAQYELLLPYYSGPQAAALPDEEYEEELPYALDAAMVRFAEGSYTETVALLNKAEFAVKDDELETDFYAGSKVLGEVLLNSQFMDYEPKTSDVVLLNMYKGLSYWALGKKDNARVEFNRTFERQRRAVEKYKEEIAELKKQTQEQYTKQKQAAELSAADSRTSRRRRRLRRAQNEEILSLDLLKAQQAGFSAVEKAMPSLSTWNGYGDFVNPYATYLSGLFFCANGEVQSDFDKCQNMLTRVDGMISTNKYVKEDVRMAKQFARGTAVPSATVWVLFENGLAPSLKETGFDIPLFFVGRTAGVSVVSFALPTVQKRNAALPFLRVDAAGLSYNSSELVSMDRVIQAEYKANLPFMLTKAVASTTVKALAQYVAAEKGGELAGLATGLLTSAFNIAETRAWLSLPKNVQLVRLPVPEDGILRFKRPDGQLLSTVTVSQDESSIVHIRMPERGSIPYVQVFPITS